MNRINESGGIGLILGILTIIFFCGKVGKVGAVENFIPQGEKKIVIDNFESMNSLSHWRIVNCQAGVFGNRMNSQSQLALSTTETKEGKYSLSFVYDFQSNKSDWIVIYYSSNGNFGDSATTVHIGNDELATLYMWVYGDNSNHIFGCRYVINNETLQQSVPLNWKGWRLLEFPLPPNSSFNGLFIADRAPEFQGTGTIYIDDVYVLTKSSLVFKNSFYKVNIDPNGFIPVSITLGETSPNLIRSIQSAMLVAEESGLKLYQEMDNSFSTSSIVTDNDKKVFLCHEDNIYQSVEKQITFYNNEPFFRLQYNIYFKQKLGWVPVFGLPMLYLPENINIFCYPWNDGLKKFEVVPPGDPRLKIPGGNYICGASDATLHLDCWIAAYDDKTKEGLMVIYTDRVDDYNDCKGFPSALMYVLGDYGLLINQSSLVTVSAPQEGSLITKGDIYISPFKGDPREHFKQIAQKIPYYVPPEKKREVFSFRGWNDKSYLAYQEAGVTIFHDISTKKFFRDRKIEAYPVKKNLEVKLAKDEYESFQIILNSDKERKIENVKIEPAGSGVENRLEFTIRQVGFIPITQITDHMADPYDYPNMFPDPLLAFSPGSVIKPGENNILYITVHSPLNAQAGTYRYLLKIDLSDIEGAITIPFDVHVFNFSLPETPSCRTLFGLWTNESFLPNDGSWRLFDGGGFSNGKGYLCDKYNTAEGKWVYENIPNGTYRMFIGGYTPERVFHVSWDKGVTYKTVFDGDKDAYKSPVSKDGYEEELGNIEIKNGQLELYLKHINGEGSAVWGSYFDYVRLVDNKTGKEMVLEAEDRPIQNVLPNPTPYANKKDYLINAVFPFLEQYRITPQLCPDTLYLDEDYIKAGIEHHWTAYVPANSRADELQRFKNDFGTTLKSIALLEKYGLKDKIAFYFMDEVKPDRFPQLKDAASFIKEQAPGIKRLLTVIPEETLLDYIDIWVVGWGYPQSPTVMKVIREILKDKNKEVWAYTCVGGNHPGVSFDIDYYGILQRVPFWVMYRYDITGFLYWALNLWRGGEVYKSPYGVSYPWAGDGFLLYPPTKESNWQPVASMRLENIRDGLEDYEYLILLKKTFGDHIPQEITSKMASLFPDFIHFTRDPYELINLRNQIGSLIEQELAK